MEKETNDATVTKVKCQICGHEWLGGAVNDSNRDAFICSDCINNYGIKVKEPLFMIKVIIPNKNSIKYQTQYLEELEKFILDATNRFLLESSPEK